MKTYLIKKTIILILISQAIIISGAKPDYEPKIGDNVVLVYYLLKNKTLDDSRNFFKNSFVSRLNDPDIIKNTLYLENAESDEIIIITFCRLTDKYNMDLSDDFFHKEIKSALKPDTIPISFRLLTLNNDKFNPETGDIIVIWEYNFNIQSVDEAIKSFNKNIYPTLSKEKHTERSYLLYQKKLNIYAGITMFSGDIEEASIVEKKIKISNKYFWKRSFSKVYRIIKIE